MLDKITHSQTLIGSLQKCYLSGGATFEATTYYTTVIDISRYIQVSIVTIMRFIIPNEENGVSRTH